jgi:chorismate dehydratase
MNRLRIGAVSYLNARPLVRGLDRWPDRFEVRYDEPSRCATLLHRGAVDLGLIPSIEYLNGTYLIVPGVGVISDGPVASVALFSRVPVGRIRSIALDTSSRTSTVLIRILCARRFSITPDFVPHAPDLPAMVRRCDAAVVIGERALLADHRDLGLEKTDLGSEWRVFSGLPFVYAFWAGRRGAVQADDVVRLQEARDTGERDLQTIAQAFFPGDPLKQRIGERYLTDNIRYRLGSKETNGLETFLRLAHEVGAAPPPRALMFYPASEPGSRSESESSPTV